MNDLKTKNKEPLSIVISRDKLIELPNFRKHLVEVDKIMMNKFNYKNEFLLPRFSHIVVSSCFSRKKFQPNSIHRGFEIICLITGSLPVYTKIRKPVSNFITRRGMSIGVKVTLRRNIMYEFLERLCKIYLPQARLFQGFNKKSISGANISFGVVDCSIFPELSSELAMVGVGLTISISFARKDGTSNISVEEVAEFLRAYDFPISSQ